MELGEWDKIDYKFKVREYSNRVVKEEIAIQKWQIEIDEINLKIANLQLNIDKATERKKQLQGETEWLKKKQGEKYG